MVTKSSWQMRDNWCIYTSPRALSFSYFLQLQPRWGFGWPTIDRVWKRCRPLFTFACMLLYSTVGSEKWRHFFPSRLRSYIAMGPLICFISSLTILRTKTNSFRPLARLQTSMSAVNNIPSLPRSILTDFGQTLKDSINKILSPIQEEASAQDELRDTVFREVCNFIWFYDEPPCPPLTSPYCDFLSNFRRNRY